MKIDKDTVVFITGGAQGLGLATAQYLVDLHEAKIFIIDLDENKLWDATRRLGGCVQILGTDKPRARVQYKVCDVSIPEQVEAAINHCVTVYGKIDAVISLSLIHI